MGNYGGMRKNAPFSASVTPGELSELDHHAACKIKDILDRIGDKWSLAVIHQISTSTKRFTELLRITPGISQRMLTATLRGLERDGLVERTVYPVVPPKVEYRLTPMGMTLLETVCVLMSWAYDHTDAIDAARAAYDNRIEA
jgi:DNA-binding HxlR family transcriptional regulator